MDRTSQRSLRVAVLAGGDSAEREVSLQSGARVAAALESAGHCVETIDPAAADFEQLDLPGRFDACFLALHGGAGEDGRLQRWLDDRRIPYTGSGPRASLSAMFKSAAKTLFRRARVPTPEYLLIQPQHSAESINRRVAALGYPVVIKPDSQGSSLGVGLARNPRELLDRVTESRRYGQWVMAEQFIAGREMTVSVLGRRPLPLLEVVGFEEIFDFGTKYTSTVMECRFHTGLPPMKVEEVQQTAVAAAEALRTSGLVRVDLRLDAQLRPWVLEVNTLPGMTDHSLAPKAAREVGLDLPALCDWMLREALEAVGGE
jgi:D-alanine-D-alanine ligase